MSRSLGQMAIGDREGDYLLLENKWAQVRIHVEEHQVGDGVGRTYICTGAIHPTDKREARSKEFRTMGAAITYAMKCLALYEAGRAS